MVGAKLVLGAITQQSRKIRRSETGDLGERTLPRAKLKKNATHHLSLVLYNLINNFERRKG